MRRQLIFVLICILLIFEHILIFLFVLCYDLSVKCHTKALVFWGLGGFIWKVTGSWGFWPSQWVNLMVNSRCGGEKQGVESGWRKQVTGGGPWEDVFLPVAFFPSAFWLPSGEQSLSHAPLATIIYLILVPQQCSLSFSETMCPWYSFKHCCFSGICCNHCEFDWYIVTKYLQRSNERESGFMLWVDNDRAGVGW